MGHSEPHESVSELESHLGYWLRYISNHVSHTFQMKVEESGVTVSEWVIMREMFRIGYTSSTEIARHTGLTKSAVSKLVSRLEEKALLSRLLAEEDQRNHVLSLTKEGKLLVPLLADMADQNDAEFFEFLTDIEKDSLLTLLKKIVREKQLKPFAID
ncbi:MAG: MarR family transcriptional regulator [Leptolyngbya sp.]|nr:MarR family transcriptional regulator [Candidatus Melainabacteria bacterium]